MSNLSSDLSGIYKITNVTNGKIYIGSALNLRTRWHRHRSELNKNKHCNRYLQNSWNKYGELNFTYEVVEFVLDCKTLQEREQIWIDLLTPYDPCVGYNILAVAYSSIGYKHDDKAKVKIVLATYNWYKNGGINPMKGVKMSDSSKLKMSNAKKGKCDGQDNSFYGKNHTNETKRKMSITKALTSPRGKEHHSSKISEDQVIRIKLLLRDTDYKSGYIAKIVGVNANYVYDIKGKKTWTHININDIAKSDISCGKEVRLSGIKS